MPQLNAAVVVVYNPPKPNFSLLKFKPMLEKTEKYLIEDKSKGDKHLDVTLLGDFNFTPNVVMWEKK